MKDSQRLQLRASEIRTRLAEIAGLADDALTDEIRSESDKLTTEYRDTETKHRAALVAESAEHRGLTTAGNVVPWDALLGPAPPTELRADAVSPAPASGNPVNQAEIIQRVFARSAVARLGVFMPSVGVGVASYPVLTSGQSAAFVAKDGAKDAAAGAITPNALSGVRLQARVQFRIEDTMTTMGLESAYREDLSWVWLFFVERFFAYL